MSSFTRHTNWHLHFWRSCQSQQALQNSLLSKLLENLWGSLDYGDFWAYKCVSVCHWQSQCATGGLSYVYDPVMCLWVTKTMPIPGGVNNKVKKLCRQKYFYFTGLYKLNHRKFLKNTLLMKAIILNYKRLCPCVSCLLIINLPVLWLF